MSASHSKELPGTVSELVGRRFRIVPGVGLVDRDVNDHAQLLERVTGKVGAELLAFAERMRQGLLAASVGIGLEVLGELMTAEVVELAGPRGKHDPARDAYRHGVEEGRSLSADGGCRWPGRGCAASPARRCTWPATTR